MNITRIFCLAWAVFFIDIAADEDRRREYVPGLHLVPKVPESVHHTIDISLWKLEAGLHFFPFSSSSVLWDRETVMSWLLLPSELKLEILQ